MKYAATFFSRALPLAMVAPDSPRASQSPPPPGTQGDLEMELMGLANALYNLGTTVINDSTKDREKIGGTKQVGMRVYILITLFSLVEARVDDTPQK